MAAGDIKLAYAASASLTLTLASLASDTNRLAGRASTAIDNSTLKYTDILIGGKIMTGTTPVADRRIEVWAYGALNSTPLYPDAVTGTDANTSITSANIKRGALRLIATMMVDATSNRSYSFGPVALAEVFGGVLPVRWGIFVTHDTNVNLNATAGNHFISYTPIYSTVEP